ncbi:hypothetical protein DUI87_15052 [Hirundo rustica rustica]|uniref:Fibronectin type-III domain-containing protein n=1 Tax=Hirundo rustica rustica TaxID=333673 RepID=A0A3M0K8C2_HIRRU|nr:hypothetical protein DUI87_15052 [Hirundo rustica rustica]
MGQEQQRSLQGGGALEGIKSGDTPGPTEDIPQNDEGQVLEGIKSSDTPGPTEDIPQNDEEHRDAAGVDPARSSVVGAAPHGRHTFTCKSICGDKRKLVCGIDIQCGSPPDEPRNVSCIQDGTRGHPTCTWDKGRITYLHTAYGIELSNGTDAFCFPEATPGQLSGSGALGKLDFDSNYTVVVFASNKLGNSSSQPLTFTLIDIVPSGILDVWYRQQDLDPGHQNLSLFWKALSKSEAGGRILGYTVTLEALDGGEAPAQSHRSSQTSFSRVTRRVGHRVTVTARNPRGSSRPAAILTGLGSAAPSAGPQMFATPWASGVLVSWEEIPAPQQRGCITGYHIYLHRRDRQGQPEVHAVPAGIAPLSLHIPDLEPGEHHELWMTAATAAGEGPRGNSDSVCLEGAGGWLTLVLVCSFLILSAFVCSVPPARRALRRLLSLLLPQWQSKAIPDPANAAWAKSLSATKAELSAPSSPFPPGALEEPETSPVEESWEHPEPPTPAEKLLQGSGDRGDWAQEEQQLPELYRRLVVEPPEPEYISNPGTSAPAAAPEPEPGPESLFPSAFLAPAPGCGGNLTLDRVKLSCGSFPR